MNDREIIEHWALRDAVVRWTVAFIGSTLATAACVLLAFLFSTAVMFIPAGCAAGAVLICHLRLLRLWRRINHLEQFIR